MYLGGVRKIPLVCGWLECAVVLLAGASFLVARTSGTQNVAQQSHVALGIISMVFALGIGLVTRALQRGSDLARTPFVLIQVFVAIGAYLGITSTALGPQIMGFSAVLVALVAVSGLIYAARMENKSQA